jgi:hypothetical protein
MKRDEELQLMIDTQISGIYDAQFWCDDDGQNETIYERGIHLPWQHADEFDSLGEMVSSFSQTGGFCDFHGGNFYHPKA